MIGEAIISIIIPCFNRLELLKQTIASVLAQHSSNWELVLVDDGSGVETLAYLKDIANIDSRIILIERKKTIKGAPACRNIGAVNATASYLIFLDSDDLISADFIEKRESFICQFPNKDFIVFPTALFEHTVADSTYLWNTLHKNKSDLARFFDDDTPWHTSGPVWKKEAFLKIGGFNEHAKSGQDWEVHVKALINGLRYEKVPESLANINHFMRNDDHESITSNFLTKEKLLNRFDMYKDILSLFSQNKKLVNELKNNVIKYFYRSAAMGIDLSINNAIKEHIFALNKYAFASKKLCNILLLRLHFSSNKTIRKGLGFLLFRAYLISNIDYPIDRTKGIIAYKNK